MSEPESVESDGSVDLGLRMRVDACRATSCECREMVYALTDELNSNNELRLVM